MDNLSLLIRKYRNKGIVVDTNLLILLLVGSLNAEKISGFKRTNIYTKEDYQYLVSFLKNFKIVTTPNILTEVSNLTEYLFSSFAEGFYGPFTLPETYLKTTDILNNLAFKKFGLTDGTIFELSQKGLLVLTDDLRLWAFLIRNNGYAINFNHIRSEYLLK